MDHAVGADALPRQPQHQAGQPFVRQGTLLGFAVDARPIELPLIQTSRSQPVAVPVAACTFYETEALRKDWSARQIERRIASQPYERLALPRNEAAQLRRAADILLDDHVTTGKALRVFEKNRKQLLRQASKLSTIRHTHYRNSRCHKGNRKLV